MQFTMSSDHDEEIRIERRKLLSSGIGFALNAYLRSRSLLNPAGLAADAIDQYEKQQQIEQEAEMRAMVSQIENLRATFEDGKLIVHMDKPTVLGLVEAMLRKSFAVREAAMTAVFKIDSGSSKSKDHDAELMLANRSLYLKFVPQGNSLQEFTDSYLERAQSVNPSEYWLLTPDEEQIDIPSEPIFSEKGIARGRLKTFPLTGLLGELVGNDYDLKSTYEVDGGFRFVISKKPAKTPDSEKG